MVVVNYVDITNIDYELYYFFKKLVSKTRQKKADQYRFFDDAKRCVFSDLLLQYSFFQKVGSLNEIEMAYNEFGKPFIPGGKNFLYNISHSGKWVVVAYAEVPVGVDIEKIYTDQENMPIEFFTSEERAYINAAVSDERAERFTQTWTLKESYVKYIGTGLSTNLNSFSILMDDRIKVKKGNGIQEEIRLESQLFQTEYYLSICSVDEEIKIHEISLIDLIDFAHNKKKVNEAQIIPNEMNKVVRRR
ncbi:MAG: 4'-phosphopantetheinyl transferase superfamily protein [Defluviitaleaceae bacterium]|nr:4'-phosphopantetheinyl transferase superfamily protein [Defluviitaleaceae bacterium]